MAWESLNLEYCLLASAAVGALSVVLSSGAVPRVAKTLFVLVVGIPIALHLFKHNEDLAHLMLRNGALASGLLLAAGLAPFGVRGAFAIVAAFACWIFISSLAEGTHTYRFHGNVRLAGTFDNPNLLGALAAAGWVLSVGLLVGLQQLQFAKARFLTIFICSLAAVFGILCLFTFSRGAWIAATLGAFALWTPFYATPDAALRDEKIPGIRLALGLVIAVVGVSLLCNPAVIFDLFPSRVASLVDPGDRSVTNRILAFSGAIKMIAVHPWIGWGWESVRTVYEGLFMPHALMDGGAIETNDHLKYMAAYGLFSSATWLFYVAIILKCARNAIERESCVLLRSWRIACRAAAITLCVAALFNPVLVSPPAAACFWLFLHLSLFPTK